MKTPEKLPKPNPIGSRIVFLSHHFLGGELLNFGGVSYFFGGGWWSLGFTISGGDMLGGIRSQNGERKMDLTWHTLGSPLYP